MSEWIEIKDSSRVEVDGEYIVVCYDTDQFGNKYVEIPVEYVRRLLGQYCECKKFTVDVFAEADLCGVCHKPPRKREGAND